MSGFSRGYSESREEKVRQEKKRESFGKQLWQFFLSNDGDEATVRFLTDEPLNCYMHVTPKGGKFESSICPSSIEGNEDVVCPLCEGGDNPSFKGAFLIIDRRPYQITDTKTKKKKTINGSVRLYIQGTKVVSQLDRYQTKYGLTNRDYVIGRTGNSTDTTYSFDRQEKSKVTTAEIKNLLPEKLRDEYDGTMDSLYEILGEQLEFLVGESDSVKEDVEEDVEEVHNRRRNVIDIDDEEDDEIDEDGEDEEDDEEETPRKKSALKSGSKEVKKRPSLKTAFKKK